MTEEKAVEFQDISESLDCNMKRVKSLLCLYDLLIAKNEKSDEDTPATRAKHILQEDILRAALLLIHASIEDFLRMSLKWKLYHDGHAEIIEHLMTKDSRGNFQTAKSKGNSKELVTEYVQFRYSVVSKRRVANTLLSIRIPEEEINSYNYNVLDRIIKRRHKIVHAADRSYKKGKGLCDLVPLGIRSINKFVEEVEKFSEFVLANLKE